MAPAKKTLIAELKSTYTITHTYIFSC